MIQNDIVDFVQEFIHPEIEPGEIFFSNVNKFGFDLMSFSSKRSGKQAFNANGEKLDYEDWFPVFISRLELPNNKADLKISRSDFWKKYELVHKK